MLRLKAVRPALFERTQDISAEDGGGYEPDPVAALALGLTKRR